MSALALQLIAENKKTQNPYLDLGNCGLTELPEELLECVWLEELVLSSIWSEYSGEAGHKATEKISANTGKPNRISYLRDLSNLQRLKKLIISRINAQGAFDDISPIKNLEQLKYLDISQTQVVNLASLKELTHLIFLNAAGTLIENLAPLEHLSSLEVLLLDDTQISNILHIHQLKNLKHLDISGTGIKDLSPLLNLVSLKHLNVSWTDIEDIMSVRNLSKLIYLNVSYTKISSTQPPDTLANLESVDFTHTRLDSLEFLRRCGKLTEVNLASTLISDLAPLKQLKEIRYLSLASTKIETIEALRSLRHLQKLDISQTVVDDLSPIADIYSLIDLNISYTQISDLSPMVFLLEKVDQPNQVGISFIFDDCPTIKPPREVVIQGTKTMLNYFYELEKSGKKEGLEAKLMLIGESGAGKTSLCIRLLKGHRGRLPKPGERTRGLKVVVTPMPVKISSGKELRLNIFDFGGQTYYKPLHHFFYSHRALYILVTKNGDDSNNFDYWFDTAQLFGGGSPVLIVHNLFSDIPSGFNQSRYERFKKIIKGDLDTNLRSCNNLNLLKKHIQQLSEELPLINQAIPASWAKVRKELEGLRYKNIIGISEYYAICAKVQNGKMGREGADACLSYLHDIGACLHYRNIEGLKNYVITEHEWATHAVYRVLEDETVRNNRGHFHLDDLKRIWLKIKNVSLDESHVYGLLDLMKYFKLCYNIHLNGKEFIAPMLLPTKRDSDKKWIPKNDLQYVLEYDFMPPGLFSRFIASRYYDIKSGLVWQDEVFFKWDNTEDAVANVSMPSRPGKKAIIFRVQGRDWDKRKYLLHTLLHDLRKLNDETPGIIVEEKVPCNCTICQSSDQPYFYPFSALQRRIESKKKSTITCEVSLDEVFVEDLLGSIVSVESLPTLNEQPLPPTPLKVFFSYSKHDIPFLDTFKKHLSPLVQKQYIALWDDRDILPGEEWHSRIQNSMEASDIVFLLLSADMISTPYIQEYEMIQALKQHERGQTIVIPIKVKACYWEKLPIGVLQGLPRKDAFINGASSPDSLWADVVSEIQKVIDEFWRTKRHKL